MSGTLVNESTATQCDMILAYLRENGSITQIEAASEFGCYRLSGRIYDLRERGYNIVKTMKTKKNRWGKVVHFAAYHLLEQHRGRWVSQTVQKNNKRNTLWVEYLGKRMSLADFSREIGAPYHFVYHRYHSKNETIDQIADQWEKEGAAG